ncbi:MAG: hypothetical protein Q8Q52_00445, partial [Acidimicrobiia bacterium]|nr:hypothetical protein [Acidimicrobiia bacterium]
EEGRSLPVLRRNEIAGVVGRVLEALQGAATKGTNVGIEPSTLTAVAAASLGTWEQMLRLSPPKRTTAAAASYVETGAGIRLLEEDLAPRLNKARDLSEKAYALVGLSGWWLANDVDNPAINALLLSAYRDPSVTGGGELLAWIDNHHDRVEALLRLASESPPAAEFLRFLLLAGVRWPVMVPTWIGPRDVLLWKMREVRPSGDDRPQHFRHDTEIKASASFHIQIHSPDPAVVIRGDVTALAGPDPGNEVGFPETFETTRVTQELFAAYATDPQRADRVQFRVRFGLRAHVWIGYWFATALAATAGIGAVMADHMTADTAAVLAIPTSLVAAMVVVREVPITARFLDRPRYALVALNFAVWIIVMWRMLGLG